MGKILENIKYGFLLVKYGSYMVGLYGKSFMIPVIRKFKGDKVAENYQLKAVQNWCKFTFDIIGADIEYVGKENIPDETCLFIGNHQSILDIPALVLGANRIVGFIAKKEVSKVPIAGRWIKLCHSVNIDREDPRDAVRVIREGVKNLEDGHSLAIYPEGTRSKDGKMNEFKQGSLKLALRAKVPIIPVTVDGTYKAYELNKRFEKTKIKVTYGQPIYTENLDRNEQKELAKYIHDIIENNLDNKIENVYI